MTGSRRLLAFVRPHSTALGIVFAAAVVASVLDGFTFALLVPFLRLLFADSGVAASTGYTGLERVLDRLVGFALEGDRGAALRNVVLFILAAIAVKNVAVYTVGVRGAAIQEGVARDLRNAVYRHIQSLGLGFYHRMKGGQLVSRVMSDVDQACRIVSTALVSATQNVLLALVYLVILFSLSWRLTLFTLAVAPGIAILMRPILCGVRERTRRALHDRGEVTAILSETLAGARLVKAHGAEGYERRRFEAATDRVFNEAVRAQSWASLAHPVSETLGAAVVLLLLMLAGLSGDGSAAGMRPELFIPFMAITLRLISPVKALSQFPVNATIAVAAAERLFELLDERPDDVDPPSARRFPGMEHEIVFDGVWFAYETGVWALRGVDLTVRRGTVVALVGPSGAGKSTLVDLLPRFIEPQKGRVLVDGVALSSYGRRSLRAAIGVVSQHTVIFNDTVGANIAYGDQAGASHAAIVAAARAANAHEFIIRLPDGYDTVLGERGMRLSGGERQRIAIARALLRDSPILILDEATSALDSEAERLVQQAIARLLENRTVLVIAHRLSTVARAHEIVVLDGGRVVERGSHDELIVAGGVYQRLHGLEMVAMRT